MGVGGKKTILKGPRKKVSKRRKSSYHWRGNLKKRGYQKKPSNAKRGRVIEKNTQQPLSTELNFKGGEFHVGVFGAGKSRKRKKKFRSMVWGESLIGSQGENSQGETPKDFKMKKKGLKKPTTRMVERIK